MVTCSVKNVKAHLGGQVGHWDTFPLARVQKTYPEMRGQMELTIVAVCTFAYTSG